MHAIEDHFHKMKALPKKGFMVSWTVYVRHNQKNLISQPEIDSEDGDKKLTSF